MEGNIQLVMEICSKIESLLIELSVVHQKLPVFLRPLSLRWRPPVGQNVKVNFDVSFNPSQHRSCSGFVVRNVNGLGIQVNEHVADAFFAEAIACIQALHFVRDMGFN